MEAYFRSLTDYDFISLSQIESDYEVVHHQRDVALTTHNAGNFGPLHVAGAYRIDHDAPAPPALPPTRRVTEENQALNDQELNTRARRDPLSIISMNLAE